MALFGLIGQGFIPFIVGAGADSFLLLETGDFILLETGDKLILE